MISRDNITHNFNECNETRDFTYHYSCLVISETHAAAEYVILRALVSKYVTSRTMTTKHVIFKVHNRVSKTRDFTCSLTVCHMISSTMTTNTWFHMSLQPFLFQNMLFQTFRRPLNAWFPFHNISMRHVTFHCSCISKTRDFTCYNITHDLTCHLLQLSSSKAYDIMYIQR